MTIWKKPSEQPQLEAGDRILILVNERLRSGGPLVKRLVILEATETGWDSPDPIYEGYGPDDGIAWATEREIIAQAISNQHRLGYPSMSIDYEIIQNPA